MSVTSTIEWGSRDRNSWDRNRRPKFLLNFHEIKSLILLNCSGDRKALGGWVRLG